MTGKSNGSVELNNELRSFLDCKNEVIVAFSVSFNPTLRLSSSGNVKIMK